MRKWKFIVFILIFVCVIIGVIRGYRVIKERYLYKIIAQHLLAYFKKTYEVDLVIGHIKGNLFANLYLEDIRLEKIKGLPDGIFITADSVRLQYNIIDIIKHSPEVEVRGLEVNYKNIRLPIKFAQQQDDLITLSFDKKYIYLNQIEKTSLLQKGIILKGLCEVQGMLILKRLKPKIFDLQFNSDNLEVIYDDMLKARINFSLNLKGETDSPQISGLLTASEFEYKGEIGIIRPTDNPLFKRIDNFFMDITIKGESIKIENRSLNALVKADLQLKKEPSNLPYLIGKLESVKGTYNVHQNKFRITKGIVFFEGNHGKEAKIDIAALTKVRKYQITAIVKGTLKNSRIELTSAPQLSRNEIIALLFFGKRIEALSLSEKNQLLNAQEIANSLLNRLFLGKAEAKIAKFIGVDEFIVEPRLNALSVKPQMPEIEVGKYLNNENLYGAYKVHPSRLINEKSTQTVSGEYSVTENMKIKSERSFKESIKMPLEDRFAVEFKWKF